MTGAQEAVRDALLVCDAIAGRRWLGEVPRHLWTLVIHRLVDDGLSRHQIAWRLGCSATTVHKLLREHAAGAAA